MPKTSHNNARQEPDYYSSVLFILIKCNKEAMTYASMAATLNAQKIKTPTGLEWSENHIRGLLKKLRHYKKYPSFISQHLLELVFEGTLTLKETLPLMSSRRGIA